MRSPTPSPPRRSSRASTDGGGDRAPASPIPLTLLTGFLGAGKTKLLNRLLGDPQMAGTAVIVNEFGEIGLDHLLIEKADDGIIELSAGCVCCTIRGELADALERLLSAVGSRIEVMNRVVIETTGLADPAPILALLTRHPTLSARFRFDGVVTVVDALNGEATLDAHDEAVRQIAVADRIVLTKTDRGASPEPLLRRLKRLNPGAPVLDGAKGEATAARLTGGGPFDPSAKGEDVRAWLAAEAVVDADHHHDEDVNRHDAHIGAFALASDRGMAAADLVGFLDQLELGHASKLIRVKGIVGVAEDPEHPMVIQAVQGMFSPPVSLPRWPDRDRRSRLVIIGRDLDRRAVETLFAAFTGAVQSDTPDRNAILANPLAVWGNR